MITIDKNGNGYFKGDKSVAIGYDKSDNMVEFVYLEGHQSGKTFVQPAEFVEVKE